MKPEARIAATEAELIEEALHQLVTAAVSDAGYRRLRPGGLISIAEILGRDAEKATWSPARRAADEFLDAPVGEAVRQGITILGRRLHELGDARLMQDIAERVSERDGSNYGRRIDVIDKRWDGIGGWAA